MVDDRARREFVAEKLIELVQTSMGPETISQISNQIVDELFPAPKPGTTDDKLRPGQTVKEALDRCIEIAYERIDQSLTEQTPDHGMRPITKVFDRAISDMESAQMWYARGRHMQEGSFSPSDVDRWIADGRDPVAVRDERDRAAGKP